MNPNSKHFAPSELTLHVTNALGQAGKRWLSSLPDLVEEVEKQWDISIDAPWETGEFNFVAPATTVGAEQVVVKIAPPFPDGEHFSEAAYLRRRNGNGSVRLLEQDRERRSILLERAVPGKNLSEEFDDDKPSAIAPAISVLRSLIAEPPAETTDVIILDRWFDGLRRYVSRDFPTEYAAKALGLYETLSAAGPARYLHGDFHPGNVVNATREPYLAIDPKGIIGHIGYDIGVFLNNYHWWQPDCPDIRERLHAAVAEFADAFKMPEREIREWAFAVRVLGAWWTFDEMPALYSGGVVKADIWSV